MAAATADQPLATTAPAALEEASANARVAVAYTPELIEPGVNIPGGSFSVAFANSEFRRLELQPGLNFDVDAALWAKAKALSAVENLMALHALEEISLQEDGGGPLALLKREPEQLANTLVLKCRDLKQLEMWMGVEERNSVRMTLTRRIKQLKEGVG
jgi:hypothetical protein